MSSVTKRDLTNLNSLYTRKPSLPDYFYHYTSSESVVKILETGVLLMRSLSKQSDPAELWLSEYRSLYSNSTNDERLSEEWDRFCNAMDEIQVAARILSFSIDKPPKKYKVADPYRHSKALYSKGWNLSSMWEIYGKSTESPCGGVCLIIKSSSFIDQFKTTFENDHTKFWHRPIRYSNEFVAHEDRLDGLHKTFLTKRDVGPLFFDKGTSYSTEQEYRFMVVNKKLSTPNEDEKISIKSSLVGIILGNKFNKNGECETKLRHLIQQNYPNLGIFEMNYKAITNPLVSVDDSNELYKIVGVPLIPYPW